MTTFTSFPSQNPSSLTRVKKDLHYLYQALHIPMFIYTKQGLLFSVPEEAGAFSPAEIYIRPVLENGFHSPYVPTSFSSILGLLPLPALSPDALLVLGPVAQLPYTRQDFHRIFSEYHVSEKQQESFVLFFQLMPKHLPRAFGDILSMINHFLNPDLSLDFDLHIEDQVSKEILSTSIRNVYEQSSIAQVNNSAEYEKMITDIIENGKADALRNLPDLRSSINAGTLARTPLRSQKNLLIAEITVMTRAAIRGGMEDQLAYQLSDQYIQAVENAGSAQALTDLGSDALFSFTSQVSAIQNTHIDNADMNQILQYVRKHPNAPLTVAGVASLFGYNSSYLSTRFKQELGFSLSSFIYRTKLEESRQLLLHTNRSLLEISEYLCFHDQSHFQKRFKQQYGMTPLQFRRKGSKG